MSLSPESIYSNFQKSIKKYFIDYLENTHSVKCFFDWLSDTPLDPSTGQKLSKWAIITFGENDLGTVNECNVGIHLFTRKDDEEEDLSKLLDLVRDAIFDDESPNGHKIIPFYDTSQGTWKYVVSIIPFHRKTYQTIFARDDTKIKTVQLDCKWGGK